jgi:hypothetical protein
MRALQSTAFAPARPHPARSARRRVSIPISLAIGFAALSGCATPHRLSPETAPQIQLTEVLRSSPCLRGRLPDPDWFDVGDALTLWVDAEGRAECEGARADGLVAVVDRFNAAWAEWLRGR